MSKKFQHVSDFFEKRVVVMGLGLHGGGQAVTQWLYAHGARVCVTDLKKEEDLRSSVYAVQGFCKEFSLYHPEKKVYPIEWMLGEHQSEYMARADLIIQNPGVPFDSPYLSPARSMGVPIENELTLFLSLTKKTPSIAVTGTRGKSTTVALIHAMLNVSFSHAMRIGIAGVGGESFFSVIDDVLAREEQGIFDPIVMEVSSYQLELFSKDSRAPHIAVVTNVLSDHLNRHDTLEKYACIKEHIVRFQSEGDYAIFNYDNAQTHAMGKRYCGGVRWWFSRVHIFDGPGAFLLSGANNDLGDRALCVQDAHGNRETLCFAKECALKGEHALENILAAVSAARCAGALTHDIVNAIKTYNGLPSRQEEISSFQERTWINDTAATSPDAVIAALNVFGQENVPRIILIAGGADKELDFTDLASHIARFVKSIIFLSGTATPRFADAVHKAGFVGVVHFANTMHNAVQYAWKMSQPGDIILLSPGCASFGMFVHEFDRGNQFIFEVELIRRSLM
jgi:UDP-N-acetylmuramoylalanine--D-glutamate ligase